MLLRNNLILVAPFCAPNYERRPPELPGSANSGDELRSELVIGGRAANGAETNYVLLQGPETALCVLMLYCSVAYSDGLVGVDGDDGIHGPQGLDHATLHPRYGGSRSQCSSVHDLARLLAASSDFLLTTVSPLGKT